MEEGVVEKESKREREENCNQERKEAGESAIHMKRRQNRAN